MKVCKTNNCAEECMKGRRYCWDCVKKIELEKKKKYAQKQKEKKKILKKNIKKQNSVSFLKKKLDKVFSEYIRKRDKGKCISCPSQKHWKEQQCGHYISRGNMNTRYDEDNCHCQCVSCNVFKSGNYPAYTLALMEKYGSDIIEDLNERGRQIKQWKSQELKDLIDKYTELTR